MSIHSFTKEKAILGRWNTGVFVQDNRATSNNITLVKISNNMIDRGSAVNTSQPTFGVEMQDIA
jgi:hypothetical protein